MSQTRRIALLLALATFALYLPVARFGFLDFDDNVSVTDNPIVQAGVTWAGVKWAFTTFHAGNWFPLVWLSLMTDCGVFGLNPAGPHLVNALFHAANTALLFVLLWRLTSRLWPAAFIAALFAWHPLHVESVAWISERKDVLSTFFALIALLNYARYVEESKVQGPGSKVCFAWCLATFALGLMTKPMLVTLPFVMLLLDFWPLKRFSPPAFHLSLLTEKIPFFLLTAVSCGVTFFAQKSGEAVVSLARVPLLLRLENAPVAVMGYMRDFFWPSGLCVIYPMPDRIPAAQAGLSAAVLLLISAAAWHWRKPKPYLLTGWLWFIGTLVPVIGLVQVGGQAMADRYTYIPSIGFFIAAVFLARDLATWVHLPKKIAAAIAAGLCLACILAMEHQLQFWRDSETLFRRAIAVTRNNDIAFANLGAALEGQGRYKAALAADLQAEKLAPGRYQIHNNLGNILDRLGHRDEALAEYRAALRLRPDNAALHNAAGEELAELGRRDEALREFSGAERLDPNDAAPHVGAAKVLFQLGRDAEAVDELRAALRIAPDSFQILATAAHYLAANEDAAARDGRAALALALKANALSGNSQPLVFDALGMAFAATGDFTNAQTCAQNALDLATAAQMKNTGQIRRRLELYQHHQPWLESFRATNAPAEN